MAEQRRVNVTLDGPYAEKLEALARRTHVPEGTLARSLLSTALEEADPDPRHVADLLDAIPGAWERIDEGRRQVESGEGVALDEL